MILLKNISLILAERFEIEKGHLLIDSTKAGAYKFIELEEIPTYTEVLDCEGMIAMKAFANGHHHAYSTLARGMPFPKKAPKNFLEILEKIWWKIDKGLTAEMNEISAYYTAISSAKNGVASVIDHHSSPSAIAGSLEKMQIALNKTGIESLMCYEISDRNGREISQQSIEETRNFLETNKGLVGLHASFTLENDTLKEAAKIAKEFNTGIHIHLAEDKVDQVSCKQLYQKRIVERLEEYGFLELPKSIFAHGLHLNDKEKEMLKKSPAWIVQNPESNLNNQVGYFNGQGLGNNIMLGTDGMHSNMIRSAQTAYFTGINFEAIDMSQVYHRLRNSNKYIEKIHPSTENALLVMEYDSPTPISTKNYLSHFFFGFENSHIKHLIHQGRFVMKNRKVSQIDEESVLLESQKLAQQLWKRL